MARTFKEQYDIEKVWYKRLTILELFHNMKRLEHKGKWSIRDTARTFEISIGSVCESLQVCEAMHTIPELIQYKNRHQAWKRVKKEIGTKLTFKE